MFGLGGQEMGIIFLIILLVFGPSQIPKMARAMGEAMREFRKAQREMNDEITRAPDTDDKKQPTSKPLE
ncbi:MAG: twin-arginine translocase TatA/TatE family subunit [Candidatus Eisenbacteria bacterium]